MSTDTTPKPLAKGDACLTCRTNKVVSLSCYSHFCVTNSRNDAAIEQKCDGARPSCGRCRRLQKNCEFPGAIAKRRRVTEVLEARALELELQILAMCSRHDRSILSHRLFDKVQLLGNLDLSRHTYAHLPMFPFHQEATQSAHMHRINGEVSNEDTEEGYKPVIHRSLVEKVFNPWESGVKITPELSHYLYAYLLLGRTSQC